MQKFWVSLQLRVTGNYCNLACRYCSYGKHTARIIMSDDILDSAIRKLLAHNDQLAMCCWHGGEPTLAGIEFFERAVEKQQQYAPAHFCVVNQIQTNGTLITPDFATFFRTHRFGVGVSIDGPASVHNAMRRDKGDNSTHKRAVRGIELLQEAHVQPSVIATVSRATLPFARETFHFLVSLGIRQISYSPVFDSPTGEYPSITNNEWFIYLRTVFHEWCSIGDARIQIRELNEVIAWMANVNHHCCNSLGTCAHWLVIDHDGEIYPCEKLNMSVRYGNIATETFNDVIASATHREFRLVNETPPSRVSDMPLLSNVPEWLSSNENSQRKLRSAWPVRFLRTTQSAIRRSGIRIQPGINPSSRKEVMQLCARNSSLSTPSWR